MTKLARKMATKVQVCEKVTKFEKDILLFGNVPSKNQGAAQWQMQPNGRCVRKKIFAKLFRQVLASVGGTQAVALSRT